MTAFFATAVTAIAIAVALIVVPLYRAPTLRATLAALLTALLFPLIVVSLYAYTTTYPWLSTADTGPATQAPSQSAADTPEITALRNQLTGTAADAATWSDLGETYLGQERYGDAREAFRQAIRLSGGNDDLRLAFAEAAILADRNELAGEAASVIEEVLRRSPANPKALWYGGMSALSRGDTAEAQRRWASLLELDPPPQVRQVIEQQLGRMGAGNPGASPLRGTGGEGSAAVRIPVRVSVAPALAQKIAPGASLFLIARLSGEAGPPLAVVRREASKLPLDIEISDADSMVPGRSLGSAGEIRLTARVANDGEAMAAPGDVFGEVSWQFPGPDTSEPVRIVMDRLVE
jgi:cytochrome c-type biogenesis protein CcmH